MLEFVLVFIMSATVARSQNGEIMVPDNKTACLSDMIEWCDNMQYPQQGAGISILKIVYEDPTGYWRVLCSSDSDGTICTRNRSPWFSCSPDHAFNYMGQILTNDTSPEDVDDDICATADRAFNDLYVQNLSYKNVSLKTEVQNGMESFFDQIVELEEQIDLIKKFLRSIPYIGDVWSVLDHEFEEKDFDSSAMEPNEENQTFELVNQIETAD